MCNLVKVLDKENKKIINDSVFIFLKTIFIE